MNISKQVVDEVNIVLTLDIEKADYADAVEKKIKETRKKVQMPGFRRGMVPVGLVRKMYGQQIKGDELNELINTSLYNYIKENKINVLGEPMVSEDQQTYDVAVDDNFTLKYDIAIAPEFTLTPDALTVPYYNIKVGDQMVADRVELYRKQNGKSVSGEEVKEDDVVKGDVAELDLDGNIKEGGITAEGTTLYPRYFDNADERAKFVGAQKFASVDFNPAAAYNNNASEIASVLQKKADEVAGLTANFRFTITEIMHLEPAGLGEELYKNVFGEECATEEDFNARIKAQIADQLKQNSDYKFNLDVRKALMDQVGELKFPEERLKKWLLAKDENRDEAKLNEDFPKMMEDLKWQLIEEHIVADKGIQVSQDDLKAEARMVVAAQMLQYGMSNLNDDFINSYAESMLKDDKELQRLRDSAVTRKIMTELLNTVKLDTKEISLDEFNELLK